jgi:hypothetical protein
MLKLVVIWWLPEKDEEDDGSGALEVGVADYGSLVDEAKHRQKMPCRVLEFFEYDSRSIAGCEDAINQLSAFMNIKEIAPDTIQYVVLHVITDVLNRMLKNYQWDPVKQEITPRT